MTSIASKALGARRFIAMGAAALVLAGGFAVPPAGAAHVSCGDTITADTVLDSDVGPCATGLTISSGNVTLDLNGFRVFGASASPGEGAGITLDGVSGVVVTGGTVSDFDAGISISGGFGNVVFGVEVRDNIGSGSTDFGDGISIDGSERNVIRDNQVIHNGPFDGIGVLGAASIGNVIENNLILDNNIGFSSTNNQDIGIRLEPGTTGSIVQGNLVQNSGLDGIQVFAQSVGNVVRNNVANDNGALGVPTIRFGNGILVAGSGNLIEDNQADRNYASGVAISGNGNTIEDNTATGNAIAPLIGGRTTFDLKDFRPDCGTNVWRANSFVTADPACTTR